MGAFGVQIGVGSMPLVLHLYPSKDYATAFTGITFDELQCTQRRALVNVAAVMTGDGSILAAVGAHLNSLVAESVAATPSQQTSVAYMKTHKTASTTTASIFFRYDATPVKILSGRWPLPAMLQRTDECETRCSDCDQPYHWA